MSEIAARVPRGLSWVDRGPVGPLGDIGRRWEAGPYVAISSLKIAVYPDGSGETGLQWHVSISRRGQRVPDAEMGPLRRMFFGADADQAEEDNHHPGVARHLWMPVDPGRRVDCECKVTEAVIVEPDGYTWTNPTDGPCRGCELERLTGAPCTLHRQARP